ncbi:MAG TPA: hypothetical protein GX500_05460 [Firmicutes bacterium]|nr:hypothetical protein [Candidatus Fermentithermobacillaceae bacterium]
MKSLDYKKDLKSLYLPPTEPVLIDVPPALYVTISGRGNPNESPEFQNAVEALYAISYGIKMLPKKGIQPEGYVQYTVFPLEGLWDISDGGAEPDGGVGHAHAGESPHGTGSRSPVNKESLVWQLMIRQPDFVTQELFDMVRDMAAKKKGAPDLSRARLETITDGLSVQMTHIGSYDKEAESFAKMHEFCASQGLVRVGRNHREIYLSDPRRTEPDKLKTVLRIFVRRA